MGSGSIGSWPPTPEAFTHRASEEATPSNVRVRRVDLVGVGEDAEAFEGGGEAERALERDETDAVGALPAPDQGGGQLQGGAGAQLVDGEDAQGAGAQLVGGLDLEGAGAQVIDHRPGVLEIGGGDPLLPLGGEQGLTALQGRAPPEGHVGVPLEERLDPARGGLAHGERQEGRAVPEPQTASRSSQSSEASPSSRSGGSRYWPRGSFQNASSSGFSGARTCPMRTSSCVAAAGDAADSGRMRAIGRPCSVTMTSSPAFTRARVSESSAFSSAIPRDRIPEI